jgi:hypothetical protein
MVLATDARMRSIALIAISTALLLGAVLAPRAGAATLYVCVKKKVGTVRFVGAATRCRRNETKLAWNIAGPPGRNGTNGKNGATGKNGKDGATGKNGTNGTNGVNGASAGYFDFNDASVELPLARTAVATLPSVPPGSYVLTANAQLEDASLEAATVRCFLAGDEAAVELNAGGVTTISLLAAGTTPFTSAFTLECQSSVAKGLKVKFARLTAVQVQTLTDAGS